jgi:selenocysteine lyase/cysteine desulfurase
VDRRTFLKQLSVLGVGASPMFACVDRLARQGDGIPIDEIATDEAFWAELRSQYRLKPDYVNLENGYYCMMPEEILEHYITQVREINLHASFFMRTMMEDERGRIVEKLAAAGSCEPAELVLTRNATESLDLVIGGYPWKTGDEAVMADQDYGSMLDMFELQARRHGIINRRVSIPNHPRDDQEIVDLYASAITDRTRLLMVCQMINITGQILPVRKICEMAHARGVEVMVDGAHAFAHIDSNIPSLGADYYGASLHKWLSAPLGTGILWIKKDKVSKLWPLFAEAPRAKDDIARLNHTGTTPVHTYLAVAHALEFHQRLGPQRKEARLRHLQRYWTSKLRSTPRVRIHTPEEPQRACAIANVGVEGIEPKALARILLDDHDIWTVAIDRANVHGCRITPNVYTTTVELDRLVGAIQQISRA